MHPGERIRIARTHWRMSQSDLGEKLGLTPRDISKIESNETKKFDAMAFAKILNVSVAWILINDGMPSWLRNDDKYFQIKKVDMRAATQCAIEALVVNNEAISDSAKIELLANVNSTSLTEAIQLAYKQSISDPSELKEALKKDLD